MLKKKEQFFGTTTIGERGQIVVPVEARKKMKLKNGDKLLAFGMGNDILVLAKLSHLEKFAKHLTAKLDTIRDAIDSMEE